MDNPIYDAALRYAALGWRVLPVKARSKSPILNNWPKEATNDPERVRQMFANHPGNIGVACGAGSGIVVLDVDMPDGEETLKKLEAEYGPLPATLTQRTGSGGKHLVYRYPEGRNIRGTQGANGHGLGKKVDVRAEGNQIVVAPSVHESGNLYTWENNLPIADLPLRWIDRLEKSVVPLVPKGSNADLPAFISEGLRHPYVETAIQNELTKVCEAFEGARNDSLFKAACSIGGWLPDGHLSEAEAHKLLFQAAEESGYVESDGADAANSTISSGLKTSMASPRQIPSTPPGFSIITDGMRPGLYYTEQADGEEGKPNRLWIGPPLHVLGRVRDDTSESWGLLLQWKDPDHVSHQWVLPFELLVGKDPSAWRSRLASGGWAGATGTKARERLAQYLSSNQPARRILLIPRTGWHNGTFILPDKTICPSGIDPSLIILKETPKINPYQQGGTFDGWHNFVATLAEGNSRLMLALCSALAAPLLDLVGLDSGGFNFVGASSTGKTTALLVAGSVWGKGTASDGYVLSWRSTDNALESTAALHSDTLLCLDELSQAQPRVVYEAAYMLGM